MRHNTINCNVLLVHGELLLGDLSGHHLCIQGMLNDAGQFELLFIDFTHVSDAAVLTCQLVIVDQIVSHIS